MPLDVMPIVILNPSMAYGATTDTTSDNASNNERTNMSMQNISQVQTLTHLHQR